MARIIAVINQKGGVGKTTSAVNIAAALAQVGQRVALLDLDPRADLTSYVGITPAAGTDTIYESLFGGGLSLQEIMQPLEPSGLFGVPTSPDLVGAELLLQQASPRERFHQVAKPIRRFGESFDFVFVDSPPGLQMLSLAALSAAEEVIIPQQCSFLALRGLKQITENIERMRAVNPDLKLCGILLTMQDRRTVHNRQVIEMVREAFGKIVFKTVIPVSIRYQEAAAANQPINVYAPNSPQAKVYAQVAAQICRRQ